MSERTITLKDPGDYIRVIFPPEYRILGKNALMGFSGTCADGECGVPHGEALIYLQERD